MKMATIKRLAKEVFANSLQDLRNDFAMRMERENAQEFAQVLLNDKGFGKALIKAQLKFNDMVNDYLIKDEDISSEWIEFRVHGHEDLLLSELFNKGIIAEFVEHYNGDVDGTETTYSNEGGIDYRSLFVKFDKEINKDCLDVFGFDVDNDMVREGRGRLIVEVA